MSPVANPGSLSPPRSSQGLPGRTSSRGGDSISDSDSGSAAPSTMPKRQMSIASGSTPSTPAPSIFGGPRSAHDDTASIGTAATSVSAHGINNGYPSPALTDDRETGGPRHSLPLPYRKSASGRDARDRSPRQSSGPHPPPSSSAPVKIRSLPAKRENRQPSSQSPRAEASHFFVSRVGDTNFGDDPAPPFGAGPVGLPAWLLAELDTEARVASNRGWGDEEEQEELEDLSEGEDASQNGRNSRAVRSQRSGTEPAWDDASCVDARSIAHSRTSADSSASQDFAIVAPERGPEPEPEPEPAPEEEREDEDDEDEEDDGGDDEFCATDRSDAEEQQLDSTAAKGRARDEADAFEIAALRRQVEQLTMALRKRSERDLRDEERPASSQRAKDKYRDENEGSSRHRSRTAIPAGRIERQPPKAPTFPQDRSRAEEAINVQDLAKKIEVLERMFQLQAATTQGFASSSRIEAPSQASSSTRSSVRTPLASAAPEFSPPSPYNQRAANQGTTSSSATVPAALALAPGQPHPWARSADRRSSLSTVTSNGTFERSHGTVESAASSSAFHFNPTSAFIPLSPPPSAGAAAQQRKKTRFKLVSSSARSSPISDGASGGTSGSYEHQYHGTSGVGLGEDGRPTKRKGAAGALSVAASWSRSRAAPQPDHKTESNNRLAGTGKIKMRQGPGRGRVLVKVKEQKV